MNVCVGENLREVSPRRVRNVCSVCTCTSRVVRVGVIYINDARTTACGGSLKIRNTPGVAENVVRILSSFEKGLAERQETQPREPAASCRLRISRYRGCNSRSAIRIELNKLFQPRESRERRRDASRFGLFPADSNCRLCYARHRRFSTS